MTRTSIRKALVEQLFKPVRWTETVQRDPRGGARVIVECGPGRVLTGLNRAHRANEEIAMLAIEDAGIAAAGAAGLQEQGMTEQTLAQEIALVTGASRGIGRAIAIELARRGATCHRHGDQ